ncbi:MAG: hypothetical protein Q4C95_10620, partial [Planctomycetia bacterium]|nr:hypothetical protein [Planctomycetia bacterium]
MQKDNILSNPILCLGFFCLLGGFAFLGCEKTQDIIIDDETSVIDYNTEDISKLEEEILANIGTKNYGVDPQAAHSLTDDQAFFAAGTTSDGFVFDLGQIGTTNDSFIFDSGSIGTTNDYFAPNEQSVNIQIIEDTVETIPAEPAPAEPAPA